MRTVGLGKMIRISPCFGFRTRSSDVMTSSECDFASHLNMNGVEEAFLMSRQFERLNLILFPRLKLRTKRFVVQLKSEKLLYNLENSKNEYKIHLKSKSLAKLSNRNFTYFQIKSAFPFCKQFQSSNKIQIALYLNSKNILQAKSIT